MKQRILLYLVLLCLPNLVIGQQTINGSIMHDGLTRTYILYVPASYSASTPAPLVLNYHGYSSTAGEQMLYGDFRPIADTAGFLLVCPMGTPDLFGINHWNVGWGASNVDDVSFTEALIDALALEYNINTDRVYSTGMSNGGFMSYKLACELSDRIAAIASVTGTMNLGQFNSCNPEHPMPVMEIHGTADQTVPYNGANWIESTEDVVNFWADFNNCENPPIINTVPDINTTDGTTVQHFRYVNGDAGTEVEHFKILEGEHCWPGSIFNFPGTNYDINASVEIWRFFSKYDINGLLYTTGTNQQLVESEAVQIYPNPSNSFLTVAFETPETREFQLTNAQGVVFLSGLSTSDILELDVHQLAGGIYFLKIGNQTYKVLKTL
ncbi:MAG: T9SS type A sorting domain-containing protein [Saprospiraceae bacterium]|nr:T9SS type A sorting domain-containing protein [Saprospiraceae bacterium]